MDESGNEVHSWTSEFRPGMAAYLLEDGSLLRAAKANTSCFVSGGAGGRIERYNWTGEMVYAYDYCSPDHRQHHDIELMPDGNILMIAWEKKTYSEAMEVGRNPSTIANGELWPDHIVEVAPDGSTGGTIVWEWHAWDHLIQDYDPTKPDFGMVSEHPERININYTMNYNEDWLHFNSVAYNPDLDQIVISVHHFGEIWIIDHSTTTEEAAGHSGGHCGMGGDLLYRWGNPAAYDCGLPAEQQLFTQHDAEWIGNNLPGETNILIFNNGTSTLGSSIIEIVPPIDTDGCYFYGDPFGPSTPVWSYSADPPDSFYARRVSGSQRLADGNTLICNGPVGYFFTVTPECEIIWDYDLGLNVFRVEQYSADYPGFIGTELEPDCLNTGDINQDGSLTSIDAQTVFYFVLGIYIPSYQEECAADCDGNGIITAADSQRIFNAVLGLIDGCVDLAPGLPE